MPEDGNETVTEETEPPHPQPKVVVNWNAVAWIVVGFFAAAIGGFISLVLVFRVWFPW